VICGELEVVVPPSGPLGVRRSGGDEKRTSDALNDDPRLSLVSREAGLRAERFQSDHALCSIEIRHRGLTVGVAVGDAIFLGAEDA
jgi:hypothetical protein